jgi:hypothetical protein
MLSPDKINLSLRSFRHTWSKYAGYDGRYDLNITSDIDYENLHAIKVSFRNMRILNKLEDPHVSYYEKIQEINQSDLFNNEIMPNITNGGLFKDWDFTF